MKPPSLAEYMCTVPGPGAWAPDSTMHLVSQNSNFQSVD